MNPELEKEHHVSYCGSYCHLCDWHTGKIRLGYRDALRAFEKYGLQRFLAKDVDAQQFRQGLEALSQSSICPGCKAEAPVWKPDEDRCKIRQCALRRGLDLCCECEGFPCETLESNPGVVKFHCLDNLREIKEHGIRAWIDKEWDRWCVRGR